MFFSNTYLLSEILNCFVVFEVSDNPISAGLEGNTGDYKPDDSNTSLFEDRACFTVQELIFPVLPDRTVNIEVITRL